MVQTVMRIDAPVEEMVETLRKAKAAYDSEYANPAPKPAPRTDIPPLCPTCEVKSYDTVYKEAIARQVEPKVLTAELRDHGWQHMVECAGMIKPCAQCAAKTNTHD
jgi:hypothetical protein